MSRLRITRHMKEFAERCNGKIKRHDWGCELRYDAHGGVSFQTEAEFYELMQAYKSGHPSYAEAAMDYLAATELTDNA